MRGYRAGYSDGYPTGRSDQAGNAAREFRNKTEYEHGDAPYNSRYGTLEEYRDGYQQGFETATTPALIESLLIRVSRTI